MSSKSSKKHKSIGLKKPQKTQTLGLPSSSLGSLSPKTPNFPSSPPVQYSNTQSPWSPHLPLHTSRFLADSAEPSHKQQYPKHNVRPSSPLATSEGADAILLGACQAVETGVEVGLEGGLVDQLSEIEDNEAFLQENLESEEESTSDEDDWIEDDSEEERRATLLAGDAANAKSNHAKEKLIRILEGDILIPKQRWGFNKILATLTYHRKDKRLRTAYRQFCTFAYHTLTFESGKGGQWPKALSRKDCNLAIKNRFQSECNAMIT